MGAWFVLDVPKAYKSFWTHPMELVGDVGHVEYSFFLFGDSVGVGLVTWVMWNLTSFRLETVLVSVQERCMVCARCTIGLQIILDAPDGTPR